MIKNMDNTPPPQLEKGTFLIATPDIENGMFFRGVILLCEHNASGSFGLLINKPLDLELPEEILNLNDVSNPHVSIRAGGPVQTNQMMILHTDEESSSHTLNICDGVFLGGDLQFLQEMIQSETGPHIHLCFGYAGWTAGQLEREFLDGSWYMYKATRQLVFNTPPQDMWRAILRQMGGKYGTLSMLPDDLSVN